jgi:hypothetical protein
LVFFCFAEFLIACLNHLEIDLSLKSIARVIGFKDSIEDSFLPVRELETNKSEDGTKQMTSLVVREPSGSLQFFSRGDLEFILEHCSGSITRSWRGCVRCLTR